MSKKLHNAGAVFLILLLAGQMWAPCAAAFDDTEPDGVLYESLLGEEDIDEEAAYLVAVGESQPLVLERTPCLAVAVRIGPPADDSRLYLLTLNLLI